MFKALLHDESPKRISFHGAVNESAVIPKFETADEKFVVLDLEKMEGMNTIGIQHWVNWVSTLPPSTIYIFHRCPAFLVTYFGLFEGMLPSKPKLESFYVPYVNVEHDETEFVEYVHGRQFTDKELMIPARVTSMQSGHALELDAVPERFFAFLRQFFPQISLPSSGSFN